MNKIKYVVFGLRNLVISCPPGSDSGTTDVNGSEFKEFTRLLRFLRAKNITPVVFANHTWTFRDGGSAEDVLKKQWGDGILWFQGGKDGIARKPKAEAMQSLAQKLGCTSNEMLYIGNAEDDMRTAVNGEALFLNGVWFHDLTTYGFRFDSPKDIAKFIDVFCLRSHGWHFAINSGGLRYYSLAPFSTFQPAYTTYSEHAKSTAKYDSGDAVFWGRYLAATIFLTGLHKEVQYVCPFPSHTADVWKDRTKDSLITLGNCFRMKYLEDLVRRHTTSLKAQHNPNAMDHKVHLDTICLTKKPLKKPNGDRYANCPLGGGKTVLVVDDICTQGFSLDAARVYLEKSGTKAILVSWLKTINRPFQQTTGTGNFSFDPFIPTNWDRAKLTVKAHPYNLAMSDTDAYKELSDKLASYRKWDWPVGI